MKIQQQKSYIIIVLLIFSLLLFSRSSFFSFLRMKVTSIFSGPLQFISYPIKETKKILFYHRTYEEYVRLRKEADALKARLVGMEEVIRENNRFEQLLKFKRRLLYSSIVASVIGRDPTQWNSSLTLDRGEDDGVKPGMSVVNAFGVIGKIVEVSQKQSKAILLTDPQFSVAAVIKSGRDSGIVSGSLKGLCRMRYIDRDAQVQIGDQVLTSKLSGSFPEGLMIGEVVSVQEKTGGISKECYIKPAVAVSKLEEVLIIQSE